MEREITWNGYLLNEDGTPNVGYSTKEHLIYNRDAIKALPWRIKEWDFYQIEDVEGRYVIQLTYGHASYVGQVNVMMFDVKEGRFLVKESVLLPLCFDKMKLPRTAQGDSEIRYANPSKNVKVHFRTKEDVRDLLFDFQSFSCKVRLEKEIDDALVISIPFQEKKTQFYYNYKLNGMSVTGQATFMDGEEQKTLTFGKEEGDLKAYAILDWGRGVWPFSNEWYWSNGNGIVEGELFGFNLGCGFGDTSKATENILFYGGEAHKLGAVTITHESDYMAPWVLKDKEGRCNLTMTPEYDRITKDKILFVDNCTHQVFGRFNGDVTLNNGRVLQIQDVPAFAEHAVNNW